jgi:hypothetical protein
MNDTDFHEIASTPESLHAAINRGYAHGKALLLNGENVLVTVGQALEPIGVKQRGFYHKAVLGQISEQVRVNGERFVIAIWKEFYRKLFLPDTWEMRKLPGQKKATPVRVRHSTEELGTKGYSELIDKVIAHAATEWGVEFRFLADEREAVRHRPAKAKPQTEPSAA